MLGAGDHAEAPESECDTDDRRPPEGLVPDPADLAPLCSEEEFAEILENLVADEAPRLFAVVQEYGERVDGRIAAWGMAFDDHAEVVSVNRRRMSLPAPENALRGFHVGRHIRARLVWFNPAAATPAEEDDAA